MSRRKGEVVVIVLLILDFSKLLVKRGNGQKRWNKLDWIASYDIKIV